MPGDIARNRQLPGLLLGLYVFGHRCLDLHAKAVYFTHALIMYMHYSFLLFHKSTRRVGRDMRPVETSIGGQALGTIA